jgi:hypothetical protein
MFKKIARYTRFVLVLSFIPLSIFVFTCCTKKVAAVSTKSVDKPIAEPVKQPLTLTGDSLRIAF